MNQFANEKFIKHIVTQYSDMLIRIAFQHTRNSTDAEDIMQDVFLSLLKQPPFETEEHLKHWIIRVTINKCKNYWRAKKRRNTVALIKDYALTEEHDSVFDELQKLPKKEHDLLYLFYYEGYSAKEIADILGKKESAIFMRLNRAREKLKKFLEE